MNGLRYLSILIEPSEVQYVESYRTLKGSTQHQPFSERACSLTSDGNCVCVKCLCVLASFEKKRICKLRRGAEEMHVT